MSSSKFTFSSNSASSQQPTPVYFLSVSGDNTIKIWGEHFIDVNDNNQNQSASSSTLTSNGTSTPTTPKAMARHGDQLTPSADPNTASASPSSESSNESSSNSSSNSTPQPHRTRLKSKWKLVKTYEGDTSQIRHLRQLPDGRFMIQVFGSQLTAVGIDAGPTISDTPLEQSSSFTHAQDFKGHSLYVMAVRMHPTGKIFTCSMDGTIKLWNPDTAEVEISFPHGHTNILSGGAVLHDGRVATTSYDTTVRIHDPLQKKLLQVLEGHNDSVISACTLSHCRLLSWTQSGVCCAVLCCAVGAKSKSRVSI